MSVYNVDDDIRKIEDAIADAKRVMDVQIAECSHYELTLPNFSKVEKALDVLRGTLAEKKAFKAVQEANSAAAEERRVIETRKLIAHLAERNAKETKEVVKSSAPMEFESFDWVVVDNCGDYKFKVRFFKQCDGKRKEYGYVQVKAEFRYSPENGKSVCGLCLKVLNTTADRRFGFNYVGEDVARTVEGVFPAFLDCVGDAANLATFRRYCLVKSV